VGYLATSSCKRFYSFTWWITWYTFLLVVLIPILLGIQGISKMRAALVGLLALGTMLLMDTSNTFQQFNGLNLSGALIDRARVLAAGAIISTIATFILLFIVGIHDEKKEMTEEAGAPAGETAGGVYRHKEAGEGAKSKGHMKHTTPPRLYAWMCWFLLLVAFILLLVGVSGCQNKCGAANANAITLGGGMSFFAPVSCDKFFRYTWWTTAYVFLLVVVIAVCLAGSQVHRWRYGVVGLVVVGTYLMMINANAYHFLYKVTDGSFSRYAKTLLSGSIIGSVAGYGLVILLGIREERAKKTP
jgi:hypothetical protein